MLKGSKLAVLLAFAGLLCVFTYLLYVACQPAKIPFYIEVQGENGSERYACWRGPNQQCYIFVPGYTDFSKSRIVMNTSDSVYLDGKRLNEETDCADIQENYAYELVYCGIFVEQKMNLTFMKSGQIPVVHIDTESGNMEYVHGKKGNEEKANIRMYSEKGELVCSKSLKSIAARGNSTFDEEKKPYIVKFTEPENVLNMGAAEKWVLLANAFDLTNLRNSLVLETAKKIGLAYTPDTRWVELYLNSEYVGTYLLSEKIEVYDNRVEIPEQESYLFSLEDRGRIITQNLPYYETDAGLVARIRYPETLNEPNQKTLATTVQRAENAILAEDGIDPISGAAWDELIDVESWARKYLIEEIFANLDAGKWSQYFYISGDDPKIYAGPAWDYDLSMAISWQTAITNAWYCNRTLAGGSKVTPWFDALSQKTEFMQRVVELYESEFLPVLQDLIDEGIEQSAQIVAQSSALNAVRWSESVVPEGNVGRIKEYLSERVQFLKDIWIDGTEYAKVTAYLGETDGYIHLMIPAGASMDMLPDLQGDDFLGWYWSSDGTPVAPEQKVEQDAQIYAARRSTTKQDERTIKLVPLGIIALMGIVIAGIEFYRLRSKRWHCYE